MHFTPGGQDCALVRATLGRAEYRAVGGDAAVIRAKRARKAKTDRQDAQHILEPPAAAAPQFIPVLVNVALLSADELHHSSCQVVYRGDDLDASFLSQFLQDCTASANLGDIQHDTGSRNSVHIAFQLRFCEPRRSRGAAI